MINFFNCANSSQIDPGSITDRFPYKSVFDFEFTFSVLDHTQARSEEGSVQGQNLNDEVEVRADVITDNFRERKI